MGADMKQKMPRSVSARALLTVAGAEMGLVIEQVSSDVQGRMQSNIAESRKKAASFDALASHVEDLLKHNIEDHMKGPGFPKIRAAFRTVMSELPKFMPAYEAFIRDHGSLLNFETRSAIQRFIDWVPRHAEAMALAWERYQQQLIDDARAMREDDRELCSDWGVTIGDGIE